MAYGEAILAGLAAAYAAPAMGGFVQGRHGRAALALIVPLVVPLSLEGHLPTWLILTIFFPTWIGFGIYANKPITASDGSVRVKVPEVEQKPTESKWPMIKWILLPPLMLVGTIALIAALVNLFR